MDTHTHTLMHARTEGVVQNQLTVRSEMQTCTKWPTSSIRLSSPLLNSSSSVADFIKTVPCIREETESNKDDIINGTL